MTHEMIAASWATKGDLARAASFRILPDEPMGQQHFIADLTALGKDGGMQARVFRSVPLDAGQDEIEKALTALYADLQAAPSNARAYEWRRPEV